MVRGSGHVAAKVHTEPASSSFQREVAALRALRECSATPKYVWSGHWLERSSGTWKEVIVMQKMGPTLLAHLHAAGSWPTPVVMRIGSKMVRHFRVLIICC